MLSGILNRDVSIRGSGLLALDVAIGLYGILNRDVSIDWDGLLACAVSIGYRGFLISPGLDEALWVSHLPCFDYTQRVSRFRDLDGVQWVSTLRCLDVF